MRTVSATQAARQFSALLTSVEQEGQVFIVTRGGRVVARIEPAHGATGAAVKALLRQRPADESWSRDLAEVRASTAEQERRWPG